LPPSSINSAKLGLILVTITAYRPQELEYALRKVGCRALITATAFKSSDCIGMLRQIAPEITTGTPGRLDFKKLPDLRTIIQIGGTPMPSLLSSPIYPLPPRSPKGRVARG